MWRISRILTVLAEAMRSRKQGEEAPQAPESGRDIEAIDDSLPKIKNPTPEHRFLIDLCLEFDVDFFWRGAGLMLIDRDGIEKIVQAAIEAGFVIYGFEGFEIGNDFIRPRIDLIADFTTDGLPPGPEWRDPLTRVSRWPKGIWIDITGIAPSNQSPLKLTPAGHDSGQTMEPVIKNTSSSKNPLLGPGDGVSTYVMLYIKHAPGESSPDHVHPWEHQAFITEGSGVLVCDGKEYPIKAGDAVLVPGGTRHQFKNTGSVTLSRVTVNPVESVEGEMRG